MKYILTIKLHENLSIFPFFPNHQLLKTLKAIAWATEGLGKTEIYSYINVILSLIYVNMYVYIYIYIIYIRYIYRSIYLFIHICHLICFFLF